MRPNTHIHTIPYIYLYMHVCCGIWKVRWENIVLNVRKPELDPMIFSQAELDLELELFAVAVSWSWSKKVPPLRASGSTVRRVLRHRVPRLCGVADKWLRSHRGRTAESRGGFRVSTGGKKVETAFWLVLTSETRELSWLQVYLVSHTHTHTDVLHQLQVVDVIAELQQVFR